MLNLEKVTHVYPNGTRALDDVTLSIPKGMYGLPGPNGAGKSRRAVISARVHRSRAR